KNVKRQGRVEQVGEVAISFGSMEELNRLIDRLRA
ncbi:MAG: chromosome partitioning protein ParB, partial [Limnohabitans sp.]|nr:chromosome partitioning protein ParB [Limnohabitans sp.]